MIRFNRILLVSVALVMVLAGSLSAQVVSPLQSGHYVAATTNVRDMATPPPGLFVLWYNLSLGTDRYIDRNGDELTGLNLSELDSSLPDVDISFDLGAFATVPALFWASHRTFLGGARFMAGVVPSWVSADGSVFTEMNGGAIDTTITSVEDVKVTGWGDLFVAPLGLSWALGSFDITAMYGFYAPTGRYEAGADDNVGLGFWTHQFQGYGYWYPVADQSTAVMLGLTYELTTDVKDSDVNPGNRFTLEWGVSQYLSERLELMVQGGHNWQISDDTGSEVSWESGVHDRKSTLAFGVGVWAVPEWLYLSGKYGFDFESRQRFENQMWSINAIFLTHLLTGGDTG